MMLRHPKLFVAWNLQKQSSGVSKAFSKINMAHDMCIDKKEDVRIHRKRWSIGVGSGRVCLCSYAHLKK